MAVSSHTLFHFVDKREYLEDILSKEFYPRYCQETFGFDFAFMDKAYILMKCFCDIPLSQISDHTAIYGCYGVGFSKEWGLKMGIMPIHYLNPASDAFGVLNKTISRELVRALGSYEKAKGKDNKAQITRSRKRLIQAISNVAFIKPINGKMPREGKEIDRYFYDEREWRYVPLKIKNPKGKMIDNPIVVAPDEKHMDLCYDTYEKIKDSMRMDYRASNIKYIFVKNESDRLYFYDLIMQSRHFNNEEKKRLVTKLMTIKQITQDF